MTIEILSPATGYYDLIEKKEIYASFGVKEYWLVDPKKPRVEIFENKNNRFELHQHLEQGTARSLLIKGSAINLETIFSLE